ncbi:hypothetical protein ACQKMV_05780 [Lysinibacillus sp. NPDC094403]|uniref:hypothetical protein n=1 Tax=Lysinibacillus sp. NPDC094403 TaxID=3390581 RepID=UPI003D02C3E7
MRFNKLWIFTILCSVLLLSACGKEEKTVEEYKPTQEEIASGQQYATVYKEPDPNEKFKDRYMLDLTGKDVQYDLANNLSKDFFLSGTAEICDYYNYGYTNEKSYFCVQLTPFDGDSSDSWYLYFDREEFQKIYKVLLIDEFYIRVSAYIPKNNYIQGQGNMAVVRRAELMEEKY